MSDSEELNSDDKSVSDEIDYDTHWQCSVCDNWTPDDVEEGARLNCLYCAPTEIMCESCYVTCDCNGEIDATCEEDLICTTHAPDHLVSCPTCDYRFICCNGGIAGDPTSRGDDESPDCCCYHKHIDPCAREQALREAQRRRDVARGLGIRSDGEQHTGDRNYNLRSPWPGAPLYSLPAEIVRHLWKIWQRLEQGGGGGGGGSSGKRMSLLF